MSRLLFLILVGFLAFSSCKKESKLLYASIRDGDDIAVDGCGWLIDISSETFSPTNLPDQFKVDGMEVEIRYEKTGSMADCGFSQDVYYEIYLNEIQEFNK